MQWVRVWKHRHHEGVRTTSVHYKIMSVITFYGHLVYVGILYISGSHLESLSSPKGEHLAVSGDILFVQTGSTTLSGVVLNIYTAWHSPPTKKN